MSSTGLVPEATWLERGVAAVTLTMGVVGTGTAEVEGLGAVSVTGELLALLLLLLLILFERMALTAGRETVVAGRGVSDSSPSSGVL